jgi:hypothetical protein
MGFIIALIVFIVALFTALGLLSGAHLLWWLLALLALAVMLGGSGWAAILPWKR